MLDNRLLGDWLPESTVLTEMSNTNTYLYLIGSYTNALYSLLLYLIYVRKRGHSFLWYDNRPGKWYDKGSVVLAALEVANPPRYN